VKRDARDSLIVALDMDASAAAELAAELAGDVRWVKVGMTLFYQAGPSIVERLRGMGFDVFLDLKLHDIPHQVRGAAEVLGGLGVGMLTVHAGGGAEMIAAACEGARAGAKAAALRAPAVLAVTVLTSMDDATLGSVGIPVSAAAQVARLADLARTAGVDGVVCSPDEAGAMRAALGRDCLVVTPGVRPDRFAADDQARVATPAYALGAGASHLVVGRPITRASSPVEAARETLAAMEDALR